MKTLKTILTMLMVLGVVSCSKTQSLGSGQVTFDVSKDIEITDLTRSNVSEFTTLPSADDFVISITGNDYAWSGLISAWDASTALLAGEYTVEASYGSLEDEGFDKPYFVGSTTFTVVGGQPIEVSIPVKLGNTVVRLEFSESFRNYYKDYSFKLSRGNTDIALFPKDETRAAFLDGYRVTLSGTYSSEIKEYTFNKDYTGLKAATAYKFVFNVNNVGGATLSITFKEGYTETVELGDYELND